MEFLKHITSMPQGFNFLLMLGIAVFGGTVGARMFQKLRIPQVVGYVTIGLVLGPVLKIIPPQAVESLEPFSHFALGIIGFLVGGELKKTIFVRFGRQVPIILLFEGVTACILVGAFTFLAMWHFSDWHIALSVAVVFGAICSATDPASTIAVLWEYKARGPLTSMLTAIVTLDDALALILYAFSISITGMLMGYQQRGIGTALAYALYELFGALAIGAIAGLGLSWLVKRIENADKMLHSVMILTGAALGLKMDVILACMVLGVVLTNIQSKKVDTSFEVMHRFFTPMYVLFFVLVGARVNISYLDAKIALITSVYVCSSIAGKTLGAYMGGYFSDAVKSIRRYLGFCLYPQGGIAVGLLILATSRFPIDLSSIMLLVVIIGAFILQLLGPIGVKYGAGKAGELGLNVTEEDLIKTGTVHEVMDTTLPVIPAGMSLPDVIRIFSSTNNSHYPVLDSDKKLMGIITLAGIRNTFATQQLNDWLIALDLAEPVAAKTTPQVRLSEALEQMQQNGINFIPVTVSDQDDEYVGALEDTVVHRQLSAMVLAKQRQADGMFRLQTT
jgi:Kef-type K+ transport system membrane component KefB/predicted transcriptional regulator